MMLGKLRLPICLGLGALLSWGCGRSLRDEGPLVRIGEIEIGEIELREFGAKLPDQLKPTGKGEAAVRDLLQSLVDREILLLEAEARGYAEHPDVQGRLQRKRVEALTARMLPPEIAQRARPTEDEIRKAYKEVPDEQKAPLESVHAQISNMVYRDKFAREHRNYVEGLEKKYNVVYYSEGIEAILGAGESPTALPSEDGGKPLVDYADDRSISAGEGYKVLVSTGRPLRILRDSLSVVAALRGGMMADTLMVLEAIARGRDREAKFLAYMDEEYRKIMIGALRRYEVIKKITVSEADLRRQYEEGIEQFKQPAMLEVTEVLVEREEQAKELLTQIRMGNNLAALAVEHTVRPGGERGVGHLFVAEGDERRWGLLYTHLQKAEIGTLVGPVKVEGGFSIFRVEQRLAERVRPLEEVRNIVHYQLKRKRNRNAFEPYMAELRIQYKSDIQEYDERIADLGSRWGR